MAKAAAKPTAAAKSGELTLHRTTLIEAMSAAMTAIQSQKNVMPVLDYLLFDMPGNGELTIIGTSLDLWRIVTMDCGSTRKARFLVPAKRAIGFLSKTDAEEITISHSDEFINIQAGRAKTKLATFSPNQFPEKPKIDSEGFELPGKHFARAVRAVAYAPTKEAATYTLQGALLERLDGMLRLAAADGRRMVKAEMKSAAITPGIKSIIPKSALAPIAQLAGKAEIVTLYGSGGENHIVISAPNDILISRKIEGRFPDIDLVFSSMKGELPECRFNGGDFQAAMERLEATAEKDKFIKAESAEGGFALSSYTTSLGDSEDFVPAQMPDQSIEIHFNGDLIRDQIVALEGGGGVLRLNAPSFTIEIASSKTEDDDPLTVRHLMSLIKPETPEQRTAKARAKAESESVDA